MSLRRDCPCQGYQVDKTGFLFRLPLKSQKPPQSCGGDNWNSEKGFCPILSTALWTESLNDTRLKQVKGVTAAPSCAVLHKTQQCNGLKIDLCKLTRGSGWEQFWRRQQQESHPRERGLNIGCDKSPKPVFSSCCYLVSRCVWQIIIFRVVGSSSPSKSPGHAWSELLFFRI